MDSRGPLCIHLHGFGETHIMAVAVPVNQQCRGKALNGNQTTIRNLLRARYDRESGVIDTRRPTDKRNDSAKTPKSTL